jgi:[protein-PII] uridylyltransferase
MMTVEKQLSNQTPARVELQSPASAAASLASRGTTVDTIVSQAYRTWLAQRFPRGMSLVAVGGYGRRELFPSSDIDLLLLVDAAVGDDSRESLSAFLRTLWDSGLRLSQSVRTSAECCRLDTTNVELSVSLLDQRFLVGDSALFDQHRERFKKYVRAQREALIRHLCEMTHARHAKYHDTIYHLEPHIKEGPGGFRDVHTIRWLAQLREAAEDPAEQLREAIDFLTALRLHLHQRSGRDSNVLTFDVQEEFSGDPAVWMREFFRHARLIHRTVVREVEIAEHLTEGGLIRSFRDWRSRVSNSDFTVARDRVFLRSPQQIASEPATVLRLFEFVGRHGLRLSLEAERRVREHRVYFEEYFASNPPVWSALKSILQTPHAALALRAMHDTSLLPTLLPAWENIECLVVRDFYHRYTVDEHTLVTIEYLEELRATRDPSRRRFSELLSETDNVAVLYMALLFHDTGKSGGLEGHAEASAHNAKHILERLNMPDEERRVTMFLIEHHLALSAVMNTRDLSDPATAADLAARVGTIENLKYLTLMTYADISAVNPEAMSPWRLEQLWRTYLVAHRELTRDLDAERIHTEGAEAQWLEGFPTRYLRTHTPEEIEAHRKLVARANAVGAGIGLENKNGAWHLTVVASDRHGLFSRLAGTLAAFGMNIVRAEAFANASGTVLDTLVFEDPLRTLELNPAEVERLTSTVNRVIAGKEDVARLLRGRPRPAAPSKQASVKPSVAFDNEASSHATLVEIVAQDRPGLLHELANVFTHSGCSIDVVLIDTEAHKAIDVFYVTCGGAKVAPDLQASLKSQLLAVCAG